MQLHAAHLMGINAATLLDRGERAIKELSMAKCYAVEVGLEAVNRAMQAHGGMGLTNEVGLADLADPRHHQYRRWHQRDFEANDIAAAVEGRHGFVSATASPR